MKKNTFNLTLLTGIFCLGLITSNLFGGKLISVLGLTVAGAIVTYPLTFLTTDIIGEIWGKKEANDCVKVGIIVQIGFLILSISSLSKISIKVSFKACPKRFIRFCFHPSLEYNGYITIGNIYLIFSNIASASDDF